MKPSLDDFKIFGTWAVSSRGRTAIRRWGFRAAWILAAITLLCWIAFVCLTYLEEQEYRSQDGWDMEYDSIGSDYMAVLVVGVYGAVGMFGFISVAMFLWACEKGTQRFSKSRPD